MDNAIYQMLDCPGERSGGPAPYPELSQIAGLGGDRPPDPTASTPRTKKFYPGVLESKYMQAVVRGGREGLLHFKENPRSGPPVPYPWPEWFGHQTDLPAGRTKPGQTGGCAGARPAPVPDCGAAPPGEYRVPSMYDPPQYAAATAAAAAAAAAAADRCAPRHDPCAEPPPAFTRAANSADHCVPCSAAPEVYSDPANPRADCTPHQHPPPPPQGGQQSAQCRPKQAAAKPNEASFVPSYLHEPENMAKIIAHDYQRQWVCERDSWEAANATSTDFQRQRMQNRCSNRENKFIEQQKCARDTKAEMAEGRLPDCRKKLNSKRPWYPPGKVCVVRRRCGC